MVVLMYVFLVFFFLVFLMNGFCVYFLMVSNGLT